MKEMTCCNCGEKYTPLTVLGKHNCNPTYAQLQAEITTMTERAKKAETELDRYKEVIDEIYDKTTEGYIIEMIDVLRGNAFWDEHDGAEYPKKGGE